MKCHRDHQKGTFLVGSLVQQAPMRATWPGEVSPARRRDGACPSHSARTEHPGGARLQQEGPPLVASESFPCRSQISSERAQQLVLPEELRLPPLTSRVGSRPLGDEQPFVLVANERHFEGSPHSPMLYQPGSRWGKSMRRGQLARGGRTGGIRIHEREFDGTSSDQRLGPRFGPERIENVRCDPRSNEYVPPSSRWV